MMRYRSCEDQTIVQGKCFFGTIVEYSGVEKCAGALLPGVDVVDD